MKKIIIFLILLIVLFLNTINAQGNKDMSSDKKGILVVSFGTSYTETRKVTIEACEKKIAESFKDYGVRKAFTSSIIRKILKTRDNIIIDSPEEALQKMKNDGFKIVIVQPLHIIPGEEYDELLSAVKLFESQFEKLIVGRPVLYSINDYKIAIDGLKSEIPKLKKNQAVIFMGHGSYHPANACYSALQLKIEEEMPNIFIGVMEGYPELGYIIPKLRKNKINEVILMPYMVVAGDHAQNDMGGNEEGSWKNILEKEGFKVNVILKGLGENPGYQDIYVQHIKDAINGNPLGNKK